MASTSDSESVDPSSNLGMTLFLYCPGAVWLWEKRIFFDLVAVAQLKMILKSRYYLQCFDFNILAFTVLIRFPSSSRYFLWVQKIVFRFSVCGDKKLFEFR